ncbi:MAG: hypothetical protein AB7E30_05905 [Lawsonibacter sp.]
MIRERAAQLLELEQLSTSQQCDGIDVHSAVDFHIKRSGNGQKGVSK